MPKCKEPPLEPPQGGWQGRKVLFLVLMGVPHGAAILDILLLHDVLHGPPDLHRSPQDKPSTSSNNKKMMLTDVADGG
eukprot:CAMPEP_0172031926 /NCGR_PEP_ID=MMETSP1041-20130122/19585_1 /TAXON_ID=464988 /ORGANISM="Hemiselmis andersenii, Strain CCMP439" /LENGTH=77 /DNA_ID=CAMNT_0012688509 /DNA_START=495 /DNA_END=723 /DNA_ORIENTATION=-